MRKTFRTTAEVCHIWASRSQDEGKAGLISFRNDVIYSYHWWPMARFVDLKSRTIVLMRNWSYSGYTSRHLRLVRQAIPKKYEVIYVANPGESEWLPPHQENIASFLLEMKEAFQNFKSSRKYKRHYQDVNLKNRKELMRYCRIFKLEYPKEEVRKIALSGEEYNEAIEIAERRVKELEETREQRRKDRLEKIQPQINAYMEEWAKTGDRHPEYRDSVLGTLYYELHDHPRYKEVVEKARKEIDAENLLSRWMAGESVSLSFHHPILGWISAKGEEDYLRLKNDTVETTLGAYVKLKEARLLYECIKAKKSVKGFRIGSYTVIGMNGDGLKIGCHLITREEINRFAQSVGWDKIAF